MLVLASTIELTRDCGPKENDELIEWRGRELEGDGKRGIGNIVKLVAGGGVAAISGYSSV